MFSAGPVPAYRAEVLGAAERVVGGIRGAGVVGLGPPRGAEDAGVAQGEGAGAVRPLGTELAGAEQRGGVRLHLQRGLRPHRADGEILV